MSIRMAIHFYNCNDHIAMLIDIIIALKIALAAQSFDFSYLSYLYIKLVKFFNVCLCICFKQSLMYSIECFLKKK